MSPYVFAVVTCLFVLTMLTRALPFLFAKQLSTNVKMQAVGRRLTAYIMMLLVLYEVNPGSFTHYPYAIPALLSLVVVTLVHLWLHKPLLSMLIGTTSFILLQQVLS
ncbi:MAG: AzlD domain-containing protein [Gammaproteobacteria bacterium]|nr:AzlD domain-containing protein [Gammaproteobacteria bacterium]